MEKNQNIEIYKIRIIELEDKLMDLIEISNRYEKIPVPVFEEQMEEILREIEYLERVLE